MTTEPGRGAAPGQGSARPDDRDVLPENPALGYDRMRSQSAEEVGLRRPSATTLPAGMGEYRMTNESFNDSPRRESGVSPRRAARAAREEEDRTRSAAKPPVPEQETGRRKSTEPATGPRTGAGSVSREPDRHGSAHHHGAAPDPESRAATTADEAAKAKAESKAATDAVQAEETRLRVLEEARVLAEGERTKALDAAQRARTQSAQRARKEAIEAQRAAAERVRQTLRANAAPLRDRSAAARSAITPASAAAAPPAEDRNQANPARNTPFDQTERREPPASRNIAEVPDSSPAKVPAPADSLVPPPPPSKPPVVKTDPAARETRPATMGATMTAPAGRPENAAVADSSHEDPEPHSEQADHTGESRHDGVDEAPVDRHVQPGYNSVDPAEPFARQNLFLTSTATDPQVRKARRRRRNWIVFSVLLGFFAAIFGVVIFLQGVLDRLSPPDFPAPGGEAVTFEVKSGWGAQQIGRELESREIVASDKLFLEAIQLVEAESREIHPGTYELRREMPALSAAEILIGEPAAKVSYVAIKQNTRMNQVLEDISEATDLPLNELRRLAEDPAAFGISADVPNLEGYLHPGEYRFPLDTDSKTVLKAMVDATAKTLIDNGITDAAQQYHVLQVASILQAEARPNDYGTVAGALENRLHTNNTETNGLLQVDSTVIYGLDRYSLQMTEAEKKDAGNAYNTYIHKGLPPTPIGSPGDSAIKAAAHPTPNDFYYWVTVDTNSGETKFAKTYAEHRVNQNEFRAWCAANTDVCK